MLTKTQFRSLLGAAILGMTVTIATPVMATNDAMLDLIDIMQKKGTLTRAEADALRQAAVADAEQTEKMKKDVAKAASSSGGSADWTKTIKLKGDMRARYQYDNKDSGALNRDRGRLRYRLGIIANPIATWEVGAGFASGGDDPRSTNQTFQDAFSTKGLNLDYAYVEHEFGMGAKAIAGKFGRKHWLYQSTDLMWDGDINPEGFSANYGGKNQWGNWFLNGGLYVIDESSSLADDPYMFFGQLGQKWKSNDWFGTLAVTGYGLSEVGPGTGAFITRPGGAVGNTDNKFGIVQGSGEIGTKLGDGKASLLFDFVNNFATDTSEDMGFAVGGQYKISAWKLKYLYASLDANAVPDFLPDSDRFDGNTNMHSHEFIIEYAWNKFVTTGLDYYHSTSTIPAAKDTQDVLQADLLVKF